MAPEAEADASVAEDEPAAAPENAEEADVVEEKASPTPEEAATNFAV